MGNKTSRNTETRTNINVTSSSSSSSSNVAPITLIAANGKEFQLEPNEEEEMNKLREDGYPGQWKVGSPPSPRVIPFFPCNRQPDSCTRLHPTCSDHTGKCYYVKIGIGDPNQTQSILTKLGLSSDIFQIPCGGFTCAYWLKQRIRDVIGVPLSKQRLIFGGKQLDDFHRLSGLQYDSTLYLVFRLAFIEDEAKVDN